MRNFKPKVPASRTHIARAATVFVATCALGAHAQSLPEVKVTDTGGTTEGSYTARSVELGKTGASVRETPQSVTVITRQQLDDRNFTKVEDALKSATGVIVQRFDGVGNYNTVISRGFDIGAFLLDGVPVPQGSNFSTALDTAVYDRVEILRGPSGFLQGAGEPGGAINLVRKRALGTRALAADVSVGSFGLRRLDADITGPLNAAGTLRGRLVAVTEKRDSHVDTLFNDRGLGYGTLELDVTPSTTVSVGYAKQSVRSMIDQGLPTFANGRLIDLPVSAFAGLAGNRQNLDTEDAFAEVEHRLDGGGRIKFATRDVNRTSFYRAARSNSAAAANGSYALQLVDNAGELHDRSHDLYLSAPFQAFGGSHKLLLGASSITSGSLGGGGTMFGPVYAANVFAPNHGLPYPDLVLPPYTTDTVRTERALYGQLQLQLAQRLKLLAGGRASWAKVEVERLSDGAVTSRSAPGRHFMPSAALMYDLNEQLTAYASYVETFVVQSQLDAAGRVLEPRTGKQVELGIKGEFLNKRLQASAAVFRIDDVNRAVADPAVPNASIAGGEVRSQGFELEASGQLAPGWDVLAGYAYTDTEYIKAPVAQQGQVFSPITPRHLLNLSTRYAFRQPQLAGWSVGAGMSWRSAFYAQSGALRIESGNYAIANAQLAWQVNDHLNLGLTVDNLFDRKYYEKVSSVARQNFYGEPRRLVFSLKARY
jgi:outer-membrane receptor for ferric coprogen and ferric-rhodotorulic acid